MAKSILLCKKENVRFYYKCKENPQRKPVYSIFFQTYFPPLLPSEVGSDEVVQ